MSIAFEYELLQEAWIAFTDASQDKQSTTLTKNSSPLKWSDNITLEDLSNSVRLAAEKLDESHGKTRRYFDKFCKSLNSHSTMLEVLPNQSQYLSILCGVVKTLLKVNIIDMLQFIDLLFIRLQRPITRLRRVSAKLWRKLGTAFTCPSSMPSLLTLPKCGMLSVSFTLPFSPFYEKQWGGIKQKDSADL